MRKLALCLIASAVLVVGFTNVAYALNPVRISIYDSVLWGGSFPYSCNLSGSGGDGTWFGYWQLGSTHAPGTGGFIETNRDDLDPAANGTVHPYSFDLTDGDALGDEGTFITNGGYTAELSDGKFFSDDAQVPGSAATDTLVFVAAFACSAGDCGQATGDCYTAAAFSASTDATLHMLYGAATLTAGMNVATTVYGFPDDSLSATQPMLHPAQAGSSVLTPGWTHDPSGTPFSVHLEFDNTIMAPPTAAGGSYVPTLNIASSPDPNSNVRYGARVWYSLTAVGAAVPTDYSEVYSATQDFGGVGSVPESWGTWGGRNYVNHVIDSSLNPGLNYIAQPVLPPDLLNTDGVPVFLNANSWEPAGSGGAAPASGLPSPATVVSFDASFDPRTGKVTLNWRSAAEHSLDGYNVWRQLNLDGRPLGEKVKVGFVPAKGPSEYSLTDEPDVSKLGRLARGRPIEAAYSLEEVNLDGTTNVIKTASVQLSKSRARRSR